MHDKHLRGVDLHLLPPLAALLRERSVGRAATASRLSQPAMSCARRWTLVWSPTLARDPGQAWLRDQVVAAARAAGLEPAD